MSRPRLLDTFSGAGGAAMGYHRAGFEVVGVDHVHQKRYPFEFRQADALEFIREHGREFDVIHASPPCQRYSVTRSLHNNEHPDLVGPTRAALQKVGKPYVIENVPGAPLMNYVILCGTMFELRVIRHRWFECEPPILMAPHTCNHWAKCARTSKIPNPDQFWSIAGKFGGTKSAAAAMGIDWMTRDFELSQAIPPAYTEWLGRRILEAL